MAPEGRPLPQDTRPLPFTVDGRPYYTLSSYDPVRIEVYVPKVTDEDVSYALDGMVRDLGGTVADLDDPQWLQAHFHGARDLGQLRSAVRSQVSASNNLAVRDQVISQTLAALAARLVQRVPADAVERTREQIRAQADARLRERGRSLDEHEGGSSPLSDLIDEEALAATEQAAALEALATKRALEVADDELPDLLGADPESARRVVERAREAGTLDDVRRLAVRNKACRLAVSEASVEWHRESDREAAERVAQMRAARAAHAPQGGPDNPAGAGELRLV
jgi:hypothetical protein